MINIGGSWFIPTKWKRIFRVQFWKNGIKQHGGFYLTPIISFQFGSCEQGMYFGWLNWLLFIGTVAVGDK